jgi:uncharacterized protein DUF7009
MKIRMLSNSIRLRLSQGDIKLLEEAGRVVESVNFPNSEQLVYSLIKTEEDKISADFNGTEIKTYIPKNLAAEWMKTGKVGFEQEMFDKQGNSFCILIEKDFKCLTERSEDESDLFPHPEENNLNC